MSDTHPRKGAADIGGDDAGPVDTLDHGMKFWERQANGLRSVMQRNQSIRTDELRRAAEDLGDRYSKLEYFERTTAALRTILLEKGLITEQELKAKMAEIRARFNVPRKKWNCPSRRGGEAVTGPITSSASGRQQGAAPLPSTYTPAPGHRFEVGDRVAVKPRSRPATAARPTTSAARPA